MPNDDDARERLAAVLRATTDAVFEVGDGVVTVWSPAAERLLGYAASEAAGLAVTRIAPDGLPATRGPYDTVLVAADDDRVPVSVTTAAAGDRTVVVARDRRPLARYRAAVERAGELHLIGTPDGRIADVLTTVKTPGGRDPALLLGSDVFALVHESDRGFMHAAYAAFVATPGPHEPILVRGYDVTGNVRWYRVAVTNRADDPAVGGLVVAATDVTEQRAVEDELALYARQDRLTGLPTRAALDEILGGVRATHPGPTAVAVVEAEGVAGIREAIGYVAADDARLVIADRLRAVARPGDVVARLGGETFAVVRGDVSAPTAPRRLGDDVASAVGEPLVVHDRSWQPGGSVGVAVSASADAATLLRDADLARYEAKVRGPGQVEVFRPSLRRAATERIELVGTLREGLRQDALRLAYQPAVRLADGAVVGAEALVRWQSPDGRLLAPAAFLPAATATGLLPAVAEWVVREACAAAARWPGTPYVAVNACARELATGTYPEVVSAALDASGLDPARLVVEVAEAAIVTLGEALPPVLEALATLGVRVAFDGAGAATPVYLRPLPVSMLKIGMAYVAELGRDEDDDAVVASLLNLCDAAGVQAVAVGVETPEQRHVLHQLGCPVAQGFLLGRPVAEPSWQPVLGGDEPAPGRRRRRTPPGLDPVVVARIRALMREGASLHTIAAALNAEQLAHPEERRWHPRAVAHAIATAPELAARRDQWSLRG